MATNNKKVAEDSEINTEINCEEIGVDELWEATVILERSLRKIIESTLKDSETDFREDWNIQEWTFEMKKICEKTIKKWRTRFI